MSGALFLISTLGGDPRMLVTHMDSHPSFSPDGEQFAWRRALYPEPEHSSSMIAKADGSDERLLVSTQEPESFAPRFHTGVSWSPDGTLIATSTFSTATSKGRIVAYRVDDGALAWTSARTWNWASKVRWLSDGKGLLLIAHLDERPEAQIWIVPYPEGTPHALTNDMFDYRVLGLTTNNDALLTIPSKFKSDIWSFSLSAPGPPEKISATNFDGYFGFDFTPDGRIIFQTLERGKTDLGIMNVDGSKRRLITDDTDDDRFPLITADGRLVYVSLTPTGPELRISALDGSHRQTLAGAIHLFTAPAISPDGKFAIARREIDGIGALWRIPLDGGTLRQVISYESYTPAISNDGTRLAFFYLDEDADTFKIGVVPIDGGERQVELTGAAQFSSQTMLRWAEADDALLTTYVPGDRANLWRLPLDGSPSVRITDFSDQRAMWFDYSPDGKTLVIARGTLSRDAVLIENSQ